MCVCAGCVKESSERKLTRSEYGPEMLACLFTDQETVTEREGGCDPFVKNIGREGGGLQHPQQ